jgi:SAM-dependent methyltransferase
MRYAAYDYHPASNGTGEAMVSWWSTHWEGRRGLKRDLRDEPLWPSIEDVLRTPGRVLEAGCGSGQWVQFFESLGHWPVGLDYADSGLRVGKAANGGLRLLRGDFRSLPFASEVFDYVVSLGAVEHDIRGPEAALRDFHRVLAPGGRLMCSVPCLNIERRLLLPWTILRDWLKRRPTLRRLKGKTDPFEFYQYMFTPAEYVRVLSGCGFVVEDVRTYALSTRSALGKRVGSVLRRVWPFYNPHMMMAVCRKGG